VANIKFTNLASSTLQVAINNLATAVTIDPADVAKFPSISGNEYFIIVLITSAGDFEIMRVTDVNSNVFTVIRAQEGTPARAFDIGDKVEHRLTAESLVTIVEEASITKPHTSTDADTYGHATSTLFSHVKITDETNSSASSILGIGISPYAVKTRFDQLLGASNQNVITASGSFVVPESGTYEVVAIGGGGAGGTGGNASEGTVVYEGGGGDYVIGSGGGAGGGGAGQVITQQIALTKGTSIPVTIGGSGGVTTFGTYITALAGERGNNGGSSSGCGCNCGNTRDYFFSGPGAGGAGGYSYGSLAMTGSAGASGTYSYRTCNGGAGGTGGVSIEGTYGNGGNGGAGQGISNPQAGCSTQFFGSTAGTAGTQGCVKIRLVLGS
jgi:hypothetical protein